MNEIREKTKTAKEVISFYKEIRMDCYKMLNKVDRMPSEFMGFATIGITQKIDLLDDVIRDLYLLKTQSESEKKVEYKTGVASGYQKGYNKGFKNGLFGKENKD